MLPTQMFSVTRSPQTFQSSVSLNLMWTNFWKFCVRWHRHKSVDKPENRFSLFRLLPGSLTQLWYGLHVHMLDGILQRNLSHIYKVKVKGTVLRDFRLFFCLKDSIWAPCAQTKTFSFSRKHSTSMFENQIGAGHILA